MRVIFAALLGVLCAQHIVKAAECLTFQGTFAPVKEEQGATGEKSFSVVLIRSGGRTAWALTESRPGGWTWLDRFGEREAPALLYDRGDGHSEVELPQFFLAPDRLARDEQWQQGGLTYRVSGETTRNGVAAWAIVASNPYGPQRSLVVAKESGCVVSLDARVFIGQGEECKLAWALTKEETIDAQAAAEALAALDVLTALRGKLAIKPRTREPKWSAEQQQTLREQLADVAKTVEKSPFHAIAQAAVKDLETQTSRSDALAALRAKAVGHELTRFELPGSGGEKLTSEDLKDAITILHFWSYQDPLEEPYGQVGYLDYLARQTKGVKVYGVMVDERLEAAATRAQAIAAARKVKSFMNLSYPVMLDNAGLLKQVGDPRVAGAKLPLFVVVGKDGKITHYHSGFYEVRRDAGLEALQQAIEAAR